MRLLTLFVILPFFALSQDVSIYAGGVVTTFAKKLKDPIAAPAAGFEIRQHCTEKLDLTLSLGYTQRGAKNNRWGYLLHEAKTEFVLGRFLVGPGGFIAFNLDGDREIDINQDVGVLIASGFQLSEKTKLHLTVQQGLVKIFSDRKASTVFLAISYQLN